jgi:lipid-A-disaccharide synthase-like uncharacterized protein
MNSFQFDSWTFVGMAAQALFFSRFILQWYQSEKTGRITVPTTFWILSLMGAFLILIYALVRRDIVFIVTGVLQIVLFSRSLMISRRSKDE